MIVFVGVATLMIALTTLLVLAARDKAITHAETTTKNLAKALDQHAARTLEAIDQLLRDVVARIEAAPDDPNHVAAIRATLPSRVATLPQIRSVLVFDEQGTNIADAVSTNRINVADRDYFIAHRDSPDTGLFTSAPFRGRLSGQWTLVPSRRINRPDGSFFGVATATLDIDYFRRFFESLDVGQLGAIGLFHANGSVVFRTPFDPDLIGRNLSGTELFRKQLPSRMAGTYPTGRRSMASIGSSASIA